MKWVVVFSVIIQIGYFKGLHEEFSWTRISYASTPGYQQKQDFGGQRVILSRPPSPKQPYIFENNVPMAANRWGNKLFISVPRRREGVPSTFNFVWTNSSERHNVPLIPYPNEEVNQLSGTKGLLVSVYRVGIDVCDRLWMVDTGVLEYPGNRVVVQKPALIIIDLPSNQIIRRYEFKDTDVKPTSSLANLVVDVLPTACENAYAYISDLSGYGVVVYSFAENNSWRINHNYFFVESLFGDFLIGGVRFQLTDGVFSIALTDDFPDGHRFAYFHSLAGTHTYGVSTKVLRNQTLATRSFHGDDFKVVANRGVRSQSSSSDLHKTSGLLFNGLVNENALGCWNVFKSVAIENFDIVFKHDKNFVYPSDVKISGDDVIVLTNAMPVFLFGSLNYNEVNFRVWISNVYDAVKNTKCTIDVPEDEGGFILE